MLLPQTMLSVVADVKLEKVVLKNRSELGNELTLAIKSANQKLQIVMISVRRFDVLLERHLRALQQSGKKGNENGDAVFCS